MQGGVVDKDIALIAADGVHARAAASVGGGGNAVRDDGAAAGVRGERRAGLVRRDKDGDVRFRRGVVEDRLGVGVPVLGKLCAPRGAEVETGTILHQGQKGAVVDDGGAVGIDEALGVHGDLAAHAGVEAVTAGGAAEIASAGDIGRAARHGVEHILRTHNGGIGQVQRGVVIAEIDLIVGQDLVVGCIAAIHQDRGAEAVEVRRLGGAIGYGVVL